MTGQEIEVDDSPRNPAVHQRILKTLRKRYDTPVMNNTHRAEYVECLVAFTLGSDWQLMRDWEGWDCQHTSGTRLEVKQSAARQSWDRETLAPRRHVRFDMAPRTRYWTEQEGGRWVDLNPPGRPADLYVFAWHDERRDEYADHRKVDQWRFFVVAESGLPRNQKSIGLTGLRSIASPFRIGDLKRAVRNACPESGALKGAPRYV